MDFLYYPFPEHDVPIDDPDTAIDWAHVDLTPSVCVARGVAYLMATHPRAMLRIDLERIDMASDTDCPLGQIFGDFADSPEYLRYGPDWLVAHGFTLDSRRDQLTADDWFTLGDEWIAQLSARDVLA